VATEEAMVNGRPGILPKPDRRVHNVVAFDVDDDRIRAIYIVVNPEKLRNVRASGR
jgi:RNA polymerase sigma-70 factor (ECF subfamily)